MSRHQPHRSTFITIANELKEVEEIIRTSVQNSELPLIREAASYVIESGGKRLRPALTILSAKISGQADKKILYLASAIELIHTASIIHDDVIDSADLRRGFPSANSKWGNHLSVLVGDFCLGIASEMISKHTNEKVMSIISSAARKTIEGEVMEVINSNRLKMDVETYTKTIELKTACLMEAACEAGSKLGDATPKLTEILKRYGFNIGIAFQIIDDLLDYSDDGVESGKPRGLDLKEGKLTLPIIYALERCSPGESDIIREAFLTPTYAEEHIDSVTGILVKYNCISNAREKAAEFASKARDAIAPLRASLEKDSLIGLSYYTINRNH